MELNQDALLGIAEVAVALVGISALVGVIGARTREKAVLDLERLKSVVLISLIVVATSLLPIIVSEYGVDHGAGWRIASGIAYILNMILLIYAFRAGKNSGLHAADKNYVRFGYGIEPFVQATLIFNIMGLFADYASALYLTFLILALAQSSIALVLLLISLFGSANTQENEAA